MNLMTPADSSLAVSTIRLSIHNYLYNPGFSSQLELLKSRDAVGDRHVGHKLGDAGGFESRGCHQSTQHPKLPVQPKFQI